MDRLWQDLRYAARSLRRAPAFTLAALATLALGIGATAAVFSVVNVTLLAPPPYPQPDRILVLGYQDGRIFHYVRERAQAFQHVAAHAGSSGWNLVVGDRAEYATGVPVSESFFEVLGATPLLGRTFSHAEDQANGPRAVVVSEALWRRALGARPDAIGAVVLLGGEPHTVVGVMPASFRTVPPADLWTPLRLSPTDSSVNYVVLGRLRDDASFAQASAELTSIENGLRRDVPGLSEGRGQAFEWITYQRWLGLAGRGPLLLLLGAVMFLLLLACLNVASLQVVRAIARRREMATRAALGGGHTRLVKQVLTESILLAVAGAALGVLLAHWGLRTLVTLVPTALLDGRTVHLDWGVLGATLAVAVAAGIFFGLGPAVGTARVDLRTALWEGARNNAARPTTWLQRAFTVAEVALAMVLLVGAGLLIRTFVNLRSVELGFDPSNVVVGKMSLQGSPDQTQEQMAAFFERTLARIREVPGVTAAAVGNNVPVERGLNMPIEPPAGGLVDRIRAVDWRYVTPEYFAVFRVPIRAGRAFDDRDAADGPPVALVNEAFARTYFGTTQVIGRSVQAVRSLEAPPREIVGVLADVKGVSGSGWTSGLGALGSPVAPTLYVPAAQVPDNVLQMVHHFFPISWSVRTRPGGADVAAAVQNVVRSAAPQLPFIRFETMEQIIAHDMEMQRFLTTLLAVFAVLSLALAAAGLYGLVAYAVTQRTQEVGIRMALGATSMRVLRTFLTEGLALVAAGVIIGIGGAAFVTRALSSLVFGIDPLDPLTFAMVGVFLIVIAGAATFVPARQASRTDPMTALRLE